MASPGRRRARTVRRPCKVLHTCMQVYYVMHAYFKIKLIYTYIFECMHYIVNLYICLHALHTVRARRRTAAATDGRQLHAPRRLRYPHGQLIKPCNLAGLHPLSGSSLASYSTWTVHRKRTVGRGRRKHPWSALAGGFYLAHGQEWAWYGLGGHCEGSQASRD